MTLKEFFTALWAARLKELRDPGLYVRDAKGDLYAVTGIRFGESCEIDEKGNTIAGSEERVAIVTTEADHFPPETKP
ncbi:hypothetical protein [Sutterella sp.]|uniref:hypothetical protein n=1 Tax=Sutterella sp. TaxID=1981025 RepID=UPI0026E0C13E|nr:hypothetical protein [Sutterella sp.]MDO5532870.1 hypothetical protein [Sutterella sp.]